MARGWESKSVESQMQDAENEPGRGRPAGQREREIEAKRRSLDLSRRRIARELTETKSDLRRSSLELALKHLDDELAKLG